VARSEVIRADLERIRGMSDQEFADEWGEWARRNDRDPRLVQERWVRDLEYQLPFAEREEEVLPAFVDAKEAFRPVARAKTAIEHLRGAAQALDGDDLAAVAGIIERLEGHFDQAEYDRLKADHDEALVAVLQVRAEERGGRGRDFKALAIAGDAFVTGV
jgi:hypothetical protein